MIRFLFFVFCICFDYLAYAVPNISATPQQVPFGQAIQLTISDDKAIQLPDLTSLMSDFTIRNVQQQRYETSVNGVETKKYQVVLTLFPKKEGTLTIGPFTVNQIPLEQILIQVTPPQQMFQGVSSQQKSSKDNKTQSVVFQAEAKIEPQEIYIGESAVLTILLRENIDLIQAQIETSTHSDYTIVPFGKDNVFLQRVDGKPVRVYQRSFLVTPNQSGIFSLAGNVIGVVPTGQPQKKLSAFPDFFGQDDFFDIHLGNLTEEVYIQSNPVQLVVNAKPVDWQGWWLPSQKVTLTEQYQIPDSVFVGQPVERHVQLMAHGVDAHKLPLIGQPNNPSVNVYGNPEKRTVVPSENGLVGYEERTFVLVPVESGKITIPAIQIDWFNTQTKNKETAILPAKTLTVYPATAQQQDVQPLQQVEPENPDTGFPTKPTTNHVEKTDVPTQSVTQILKQTYGLFGVFELVLMGIVLLFLLIIVGIIRYEYRYRFSRDKKSDLKKSKKPLPDLYPFE